jgi:anti-sigma regulatory factor (Ser/Thr protein kinase)
MCWQREYLDAEHASKLRREIGEYLRRHSGGGSDVDAGELIVGELLSNVARYAPGPVCVDLDWTTPEPTLIIHDSGPGFQSPVQTDVPKTAPESGRGLYLIALLARQLIAEHVELGGMRMRAVLPVTRGADFTERPCPLGSPFRSGRSCPYSTTLAAAQRH